SPHLLEANRAPRHRERFTWPERSLVLRSQRRRCCDAERDEEDAEVRDVAAVASPVAADEAHERDEPSFTMRGASRTSAEPELAQVRRGGVSDEREREDPVKAV